MKSSRPSRRETRDKRPLGRDPGRSWCHPRTKSMIVGLGGLGVTCSPRDPRFAGSNPAEVDGFFQDVKILCTSPPEKILSSGIKSEISSSLKNVMQEKKHFIFPSTAIGPHCILWVQSTIL